MGSVFFSSDDMKTSLEHWGVEGKQAGEGAVTNYVHALVQ